MKALLCWTLAVVSYIVSGAEGVRSAVLHPCQSPFFALIMSFPEPVQALVNTFAVVPVRAIPTGGASTQDLREWLREPAVLVLEDTWIGSRQAIAARDRSGIWEGAKDASLTAVEARPQKEATQ